jgi:hypothetical protein
MPTEKQIAAGQRRAIRELKNRALALLAPTASACGQQRRVKGTATDGVNS